MKKKKKIQVQGRDDKPTKKEKKILFRSRNEALKPKPSLTKKFPRSKLEVEEPKKRKRNVSSRRFLKKNIIFLKFRFETYPSQEKLI